MSTPTVNGNRIQRMTLTAGDHGPWIADIWCEQDPSLQGQVTIKHGTTTLIGTAKQVATHVARTALTAVGGAGQWGKVVAAKGYHLDTQVRAALVFADLCRETGERAGTFTPSSDRLGVDFVRNADRASTILESIIGSAKWWVDYAGLTQVGQHASNTPKRFEVLGYDPVKGSVELALDDLNELRVGSVLVSDRLSTPVSVQSYQINISDAGIRATCQAVADMPALLRGIIAHEIARSAPQIRKYRVTGMTPDGRVELQIVQQASGYPNLVSIEMWSAAGTHAELTPGCEVLVDFVDGDRAQPVIVGFRGLKGGGFRPESVALDSDDVRLGSLSPSDAAAVASYVDARIAALQSAFDSHTHLHGPYASAGGPPVPTATPLPLVGSQPTVASTVVRIEP